jgi:uncharacterized protein YggE
MKRLSWMSVVIVAGIGVLTGFAQLNSTPGTVSVTGTHTIRVAPDEIRWSLSVSETDMELSAAVERVEAQMKALLVVARDPGLASEDIQTGHLSMEKRYRRNRADESQEFIGFDVRRSLTLKQKDLTKFEEYLQKFVGNADIEADYRLESSRRADLRWQARVEAMKLAQRKAGEMAEAVGATLGGPSVVIEGVPSPGRGGYAMYGNSYSTNSSSNNNAEFVMPGAPAENDQTQTEGTFAPGMVEVKESVTVVFNLG